MASACLIIAGDLAGPKPLGFWTCQGAVLGAPETTTTESSHFKEHPRLQRLVELKHRWDTKGNLMPVLISIKKSQQVNALAAHICLPTINLRP
ncbi:hypothetical protein GGR50DRAFT_693174 [Xylaria sp. CBS 124048]|nr:hypothetical protein GGR50DRAFT_693174 [Xylaria sp. CBS 124048]